MIADAWSTWFVITTALLGAVGLELAALAARRARRNPPHEHISWKELERLNGRR